jgi:hypothetical protein
MSKTLGYTFIGIGLIVLMSLLNFGSATIPLKELWLVVSVIIIIVGCYLILKARMEIFPKPDNYNTNRSAEIRRLKTNGDKVRVTLDTAEVKTRSYRHELISADIPSRLEMMDSLFDSNRNHKTQDIEQTYLVYHHPYRGKMYKFISQPISKSEVAVRQYIDADNGVNLYIDSQNPNRYYFEIPL